MTMLYPIVLETEENGAVSAYVPGLPVYAAADSHAKAERAIRAVLKEYLTRTRPVGQTHGSASHASPIEGSRESASLALPLWSARSAATRRRVPRVPTAGSAGALPRPRPHERLGRRPRANGSPDGPPRSDLGVLYWRRKRSISRRSEAESSSCSWMSPCSTSSGARRAVRGLTADEFTVLENGVRFAVQ